MRLYQVTGARHRKRILARNGDAAQARFRLRYPGPYEGLVQVTGLFILGGWLQRAFRRQEEVRLKSFEVKGARHREQILAQNGDEAIANFHYRHPGPYEGLVQVTGVS